MDSSTGELFGPWTMACAVLAAVSMALLAVNVRMWREIKNVHELCMKAWIRLDEKQQAQNADRRERDQLIRRLARAEAAMDGLRAIAQESAMLAQLDALRADSCWAPLHELTDEVKA